MPKNMSFAMTTAQVLDESKTVTRRDGWWNLKAGDLLWAVDKTMGLKKGETPKRLKLIRVVKAYPERLDEITQEDVVREGFPEWTPEKFVKFFCDGHHCTPDKVVMRIQFAYMKLDPAMPVEVPPSLAVCPICKGKLFIVECGQWVEGETGLLIPDEIHTECEHAPEIEDEAWDEWFEGHYAMPYVDWLPVNGKIESWFAKWFRYTRD